MRSVAPLDCAQRRRSPAPLSSFPQGRPPRNKGVQYPPDPPTVEEIRRDRGKAREVIGLGREVRRLPRVHHLRWATRLSDGRDLSLRTTSAGGPQAKPACGCSVRCAVL